MSVTTHSDALSWKWVRWLTGGIFVGAAVLLLFVRTVDRDLNHDEHQFLAPAALLSREGLQPWRDYPLFHLPNLVFAYAAADRLTGDLILGAKLVCFIASALFLVGLTAAGMQTRRLWIAVGLVAAALTLLLADPLFRYTAGKTWNHEVPTALLVAAIASVAAATRRDSLFFSALAGACGGFATGCRLTFAPTLAGLFLFVWLMPIPNRRRSAHALLLTAAAFIAMAPSLYYLLSQPESFLFGNLEFQRLRLLDPSDTRAQETTTLWRKLRFFWKEIIRESWPVFLLFAAATCKPAWRWLRKREGGDIASAAVLLTLPFLLLGCFTPARYQYQHFFVFIPVLVYGIVAGIRRASSRWQIGLTSAAIILSAVQSVSARRDYLPIASLKNRTEWFPSKANVFGKRISAELGGAGPVLTLAPALVLVGGLDIYPELATGAFGWRGAHHVPAERRNRLHLLAPEDLEDLLATRQPRGILTGVEEPEEEKPLVEWAQAHNLRPIDLKKGRTLWVSASPASH